MTYAPSNDEPARIWGSRDLTGEYPQWKWARYAFQSDSLVMGVLWLVVRLYLGYVWLTSGIDKITGDGWLNGGGAALKGFTTGAIQASTQGPNPPVNYDWWVNILEWVQRNASWIAKIIPFVELAVGIGLILGLFTGIAAFVGLCMNTSFMLSGVAGVNPVFMILSLGLVIAWRNAGLIGLDRWVLRWIGSPHSRERRARTDGRLTVGRARLETAATTPPPVPDAPPQPSIQIQDPQARNPQTPHAPRPPGAP